MSPLVSSATGNFWSSTGGGLLVAVVCAVLIGVAVAVLLLDRRSRGGVRTRVGEFITPPRPSTSDGASEPLGRLFSGTERRLEGGRRWEGFKETLELARIERPAIQIVSLTAAGSLGAAVLLLSVTGSALAAALVLIVVPLLVRTSVNHRLRRQRILFAEMLPAHLEEVSAALRGGHSLVTAIAAMAETATEPARGEFQRVVADEQLGLPLEDSLRTVAGRMQDRDMEQFALVAELHGRTGGNMAEVLDRVAEAVRERTELNRELRALTAQARISRTIVTALPVFLLIFIYATSRAYLSPLLHTPFGNFLLGVAALMVILGSIVMGRIARIEV
jgi:tight adherence protein B